MTQFAFHPVVVRMNYVEWRAAIQHRELFLFKGDGPCTRLDLISGIRLAD